MFKNAKLLWAKVLYLSCFIFLFSQSMYGQEICADTDCNCEITITVLESSGLFLFGEQGETNPRLNVVGETGVYTYTIDAADCEEEPCEAPQNLTCQNGALTWDWVPSTTYRLYIQLNDPSCDCTAAPLVSLLPIETNTNKYLVPANLANPCFFWRVVAICADGTQSEFSEAQCYRQIACSGGRLGNGKRRGEENGADLSQVDLGQAKGLKRKLAER